MLNQIFSGKENELRSFFLLASILGIIFVLSFVFGLKVRRDDVSNPTQIVYQAFPEVSLQAKAVYIYDVRTKAILYAKNENTRYPLASLTKVMSALVALESSPSYSSISIDPEALRAEGDTGLLAREKWRLKDILDFSLITSSNDGMRAVALSLGALSNSQASDDEIVEDFVRSMNAKALELDLKNTYFWNETGLDESDNKSGAYGTARDVTSLLEYVLTYHPDLLQATRESSAVIKSLDNRSHIATNTNEIADDIPGLLASKTGWTDQAGGNLAFAFDPELGRPIIITILGSTLEGRFEDARALISATLEFINSNQD